MTGSRFFPVLKRVVGWGMLALGLSVFAVRLQHEGPYALPRGGNGLAGVLSLAIGALLVRDWAAGRGAAALGWIALAASPVVFFFALYATAAELEEVVVLRKGDADLRLWIVDREGVAWVTMPGAKAERHALDGARAELLRGGETRCVLPARHDDPEVVNGIHRLRHEKYAVQRLAAAAGYFGRDAKPGIVALRLDPCPGAAGS